MTDTARRKIGGRLLRLGLAALAVQAVLAGPAWAVVQEERQVTLDVAANQNWVSGPGAAQSFLLPGRHVASDFSYRYRRTDGDQSFVVSLHGRSTDDRTVDSQTWSLSNLELGWSDAVRRYAVGDVMADFSPYSLTGAVKGASYSFRPGAGQPGQPEISFVHGVSYPRWENFWGGADLKAIKRTVSGVNVRQPAGAKADLGVSVVRTSDSGRLADWDELFQNNLYAVNWEFRPQAGLTFKGESAFSRTVKSPAAGVADEQLRGNAHLLAMSREDKRQKWFWEYERVSPQFTTLLGWAFADQERAKVKWTSQLSPDLGLTAGLAWARNKLGGSSQPYRTDIYQPEIVLSFNAPFKRDNATLDLGLRLDRRCGGGTGTADRSVTAAYRDVFGNVDADISLDYALADTAPYDFGTKNKNLTFSVTLGGSVKKDEYILRPTLNIAYTRNTDVLNHYHDRMFEASVGLGYTRPQDDLSATLRVGKNQNLKQVTPDAGKWFANFRLEARPKYLRLLSENAKQYLEVSINTYKFDDAGNNYRETSVVTGIRFEY